MSYINCRLMVRRDFPEVPEIEHLAFPQFPWSEDDFLKVLRQRNCIGKVVEINGEVCGFVIYELCKGALEILNIGVHPSCWRKGIGSLMVDILKRQLSPTKRSVLAARVRETNVAAQLFFTHHGFRVYCTERQPFEDSDEDAYLFVYEVPIAQENEVVLVRVAE